MAEILLVEDDAAVSGALVRALNEHGLQVVPVCTALEALRTVTVNQVDLVVLDLGLPDLDGTAVLRMLRGVSTVPVIIATARSDERSVVELLNLGADDYVVKPFASEQLVARINALLRRTSHHVADHKTLAVGGLRVDIPQRIAELDGRPLKLHRLEFDVLSYLAARPDIVVTRRELSHNVWQRRNPAEDQTIDVHISWLRRKLGETAASPRYLHTVRGVGFS